MEDPRPDDGPGTTGDAHQAPRRSWSAPRWLRRAVLCAVLLAGAGAGALLLAPKVSVSGPVLFGDVTVQGRGPWGTTRLEVPPVGSVGAHTHRGPVAVSVRLESVDLDRLSSSGRTVLAGGRLTTPARDSLSVLARRWVVRTTLAATALGATWGALVALATRRHGRRALVLLGAGALAATVAWSTAVGVAWASFDDRALDSPSYRGALRYAPRVLAAVEGSRKGWEKVRRSTDALTGRLEALARTTGDGPDPAAAPGDVVLLHVSDLHLNPLGMDLVRRLAAQFHPDAVLDTGDLTSFGATPDEGMFASLATVDVPYYLVPGNHDSAAAVRAAAATGKVVVLDGEVVDVGGLRLAGLADPTFTPGQDLGAAELSRRYRAQRPALAALATAGVDLLAVHNPVQAAAARGRVPAVAAGHLHRFTAEAAGGTTLVVTGSTGAGGLGSLGSTGPASYQAELLRFRPQDGRYRLWAVDRITVDEDALLERGPGTSSVERLDPAALRSGRLLTGRATFEPEPSMAPTTSSPASPTTAPAAGAPRRP